MRPLLMLAVLGIATSPLQGQERLGGTWEGYWSRAGDSMHVTLDVRRDAAGDYAATFGADRLRVAGIPFNEVRVTGCCDVVMLLRGDRTTLVFNGTIRNDSLIGTLQETGVGDGRFAYVRTAATAAAFEEREVAFTSGDVKLAGTLLLPKATTPVPAVVFVHGSGAEGRWASRFLASKLASRGIAALIFDKRGVGGSSGDWRRATIDDLAADAAAAVAFLYTEPRIDSTRIGIHGHSQGGTIAPLVAAKARSVAFVIGSAAAGLPTDSTEIFSILNSVLPAAASAADSADARMYVSELIDVAYHGKPRTRLDSLAAALRGRPWLIMPPPPEHTYWFFSPMYARYNALEWWSRVRVPVLLLYGEQDQRVQAKESAARITAALRNAGNTDVTVRIYPRADHTFRLPPGPGGWPVTAPSYVADLVEWIAQR